MRLARIAITIPPSLVKLADRRARALGRSRSWVLVQALQRYLSDAELASPGPARQPASSGSASSAESALGEYRRSQLEADLGLTAEERVKEAERTGRVAEIVRPRWRSDRVITFDRYEDYLAWLHWEERAR
ncbi:ribbon-helix-helix protein, CopG family [Actinocrinis sp.]|uniref:ribbon-helix-helix protein, CopG family n=1 Tax=Actinocrinis sp. TaxID=1920516 RepID=UPI002B9D0565|nr:ribbon-helix-helix protein, CopG family [Actinocrinis sp.]HXR71029.1 ribbon-helix-helix protein, CopG family [Actinocrinis sp.]